MRSDRVAETLLSLVAPSDRVTSVIGDLAEEASHRGGGWFWRSVTRLWFSLLGRDLLVAPWTMAASCVVGWFVYMVLSAILALSAYIAVTVVWGILYVFANHTGLELLVDLTKIRLDWPPIPEWATYGIQVVVLFAIAPFQIGRSSSHFWRGHEVSLALVMLLMWTAMSIAVPFVGVGVSARPSLVPVMVLFAFAGALFQRFRPALS